MNESTLVPREGMSGLDWLARNVHTWPDGKEECLVVLSRNPYPIWSVCKSSCGWIERSEWLSRRAELQNKPSWDDAPEWANWLAQDEDGEWKWLGHNPSKYINGWTANKLSCCKKMGPYGSVIEKGTILGDWRDTLEKRPEQDEFEPFASVEDEHQELSELEMLAKVSHLISDKRHRKQFTPFASVEDAATAKQPAPKGSGSPILGMVLTDMTNRALEGKEKYGEPLLAHNGRNPLWDAYQEALDLAMYLRQAIEEQKQ